ncbi:phage baseplate J family protein [Clostridium aceticum]|uniref:Phage baseplate J family protein n=1 Tax=Clostridium aceticum TaxID=84022 RepID=A0A0D8IC92_9CLOT|nr:baseplate J/gp47 family protein [Clostridium aceticum]AKL95024.1 phage baseplate J family protein [Clostridium aceticum]KJF27920.1 hypothetical protein TZ02_04930 [Clostridium aceticum]
MQLIDLNNLPEVEFAQKDIKAILADTIAGYEEAYFQQHGKKKKLYPGDPIRIFLYTQALREFQLRQIIDFSAKQNLLKYSTGPFLENLAALREVEKLPASPAKVSQKFILNTPQSVVQIIPRGTRVSPGGDIYFEVKENMEVPIGEIEITAMLECTSEGKIGNGFMPGQINILVDALPFIESTVNLDESQGGSDVEDDENFRERIRLAPESYSVAGPAGAYEFFAKKYSSAIQDVRVFSPSAGVVDVRVLLENGEIPNEAFLLGLKESLSDKTIRPLTDHVIVGAPKAVEYDIELTYYILSENAASVTSIQGNIQKAVNEYILWQKTKIGRDINPSELVARIRNAGAKRVEIIQPSFIQLQNIEVAKEVNVSVNYGGLEDD